MQLWLHKQAECEFEEACEFYERRQTGLGKRFRGAVLETLREIVKDPERWPARGRFRKCLVPIFRYKIYYEISADALNIVAIAHPSRRPGYWKKRISDEQR
jgi:toxin ParE1/3/4